MPVKIRLQRRGRKKRPFYHIVVADVRAPRDGRYIERLGTYNPMTKPATIEIDRMKAYEWLVRGAQPTDTARAILRFKGVYYRKHLMRGVKKGVLTEEEAETKFNEWVEAKEANIAERFAAAAKEREEFHAMVSGQAPPAEEPVAEKEPEASAAEEEEEAPAAETEPAATTKEEGEEKPKAEGDASNEEE